MNTNGHHDTPMVCPSERPQAQRRTHRQIDGAGCYDCPRSLCMLSVRRFIGHGGRLLLAVPMLGLMWWSSERTMTVRMPAAACVDEATHRTPSRNDKVIRTALLSLLHSLSLSCRDCLCRPSYGYPCDCPCLSPTLYL